MDYRLGEWRYAGPRGWQSAEVLVGSVRCTAPGLRRGDRRGRVGLAAARHGGGFLRGVRAADDRGTEGDRLVIFSACPGPVVAQAPKRSVARSSCAERKTNLPIRVSRSRSSIGSRSHARAVPSSLVRVLRIQHAPHSPATALAHEGKTLPAISAQLGHSSTAVTDRHLRVPRPSSPPRSATEDASRKRRPRDTPASSRR